ncbi:MAG: PrgI family protein [Verrucomicrobiae bacterium]|nr:PrgI family protein [Verrucomicrobiae bacterium]
MEVKVPKEIRDYQESIYFGLSARQFVFSLLAIAVAVITYFSLRGALGTETVSWLCVLMAAPFAAIGFLRYNGMPFERLVVVWIRSAVLIPSQLKYKSENLFEQAVKHKKGNDKHNAIS